MFESKLTCVRALYFEARISNYFLPKHVIEGVSLNLHLNYRHVLWQKKQIIS